MYSKTVEKYQAFQQNFRGSDFPHSLKAITTVDLCLGIAAINKDCAPSNKKIAHIFEIITHLQLMCKQYTPSLQYNTGPVLLPLKTLYTQ